MCRGASGSFILDVLISPLSRGLVNMIQEASLPRFRKLKESVQQRANLHSLQTNGILWKFHTWNNIS